MVPHSRCSGVDRAAIIRAKERRERDKNLRMEKNYGGRNNGGQNIQQITTKRT